MKTQALINVLTRLNFYSRINHVPSKLKNTFKVLVLALSLTSCEKAESLVPIEYDDKTRVSIFADSCVVQILIDGKYTEFGSATTQSTKYITLESGFEFISIYRLYGKRFNVIVSRGMYQKVFDFNQVVYYANKKI